MQNIIGHHFVHPEYCKHALTHPSFKQGMGAESTFQRYEFLGDAILELIIREALMKRYPEEQEGALSKRKAALVSKHVCDAIARRVGLDALVRIGHGVNLENTCVLADALEALIAAIWFDSGGDLLICRSWILERWEPFLLASERPPMDPKMALQEWSQSRFKTLPIYRELERTGPDHKAHFKVQVSIPGSNAKPCVAEGPNKRCAEKEAARCMLLILEDDN
jgi:ribonuclease-3